MIKVEIKKAKNGQWYARIKARNGRILFHSETYKRKRDAINAWSLVESYSGTVVPVVVEER